MAANLHVLPDAGLLNVPAVLRALADDMERGSFGAVHGCAVVWDSQAGLDVSYSGTGEASVNAHFLLHAGAAKMMSAVMRDKGC